MASFALYQTVPEEKVSEYANELRENVPKWFADNPKRRVCNVQWFYGKLLKLRRKNYKELIEQAVTESLPKKK